MVGTQELASPSLMTHCAHFPVLCSAPDTFITFRRPPTGAPVRPSVRRINALDTPISLVAGSELC